MDIFQDALRHCAVNVPWDENCNVPLFAEELDVVIGREAINWLDPRAAYLKAKLDGLSAKTDDTCTPRTFGDIFNFFLRNWDEIGAEPATYSVMLMALNMSSFASEN